MTHWSTGLEHLVIVVIKSLFQASAIVRRPFSDQVYDQGERKDDEDANIDPMCSFRHLMFAGEGVASITLPTNPSCEVCLVLWVQRREG
jgi:hypothetical protein